MATDTAAIFFGAKYEIPVERKVAKVDPRISDSYVGEYESTSFVLTVIREGDKLVTQATGQPKVEIFPAPFSTRPPGGRDNESPQWCFS